jgi:hypothetical protein
MAKNKLDEALELVSRAYFGNRGWFAYSAFDWINATLHGGALPRPLIVWGITPFGGCLGLTPVDTSKAPCILLHPSILGGTQSVKPWGVAPEVLGRCYAVDVLIHECT